MVLAEIIKAAQLADAVVLAQASMARLVPQLGNTVKVPILSSPALGVKELRRVLEMP
jgi:Asp/Glu/hydantoin racemase